MNHPPTDPKRRLASDQGEIISTSVETAATAFSTNKKTSDRLERLFAELGRRLPEWFPPY